MLLLTMPTPTKGAETREAVLHEALLQASRVGLQGITIGGLAESTGMSKSGLFGHFRSKEQLQVGVLEHAARQFRRFVVEPALQVEPGEPRVRELFGRWLGWDSGTEYALPGGCIFITATHEFDDGPDGPVRDLIAGLQRRWLTYLASTYRDGVSAGQFRADLAAEDFAYDLYGVMLAFNVGSRLLREPAAEQRARDAVERLLDRARA